MTAWAWEVYAHLAFLKAQTTVSGAVLVTGASSGILHVTVLLVAFILRLQASGERSLCILQPAGKDSFLLIILTFCLNIFFDCITWETGAG